ncbi:MAG: hypothetical protein JXB50_00080 [Spirochaetes bacterium]|nr:hypothetical protein [Spirochaetota bacterium]
MENNLNFLSTRDGFNISLKHFNNVNQLIKSFNNNQNLADLIINLINKNEIKQYQIRAILNALLIDKFKYFIKSYNLTGSVSIENLNKIFEEINTWNAFDFIISYYHPQLGIILLNPKNIDHLDNISDGFKENELINIYTGNFSESFDLELAEKASNLIIDLLNGGNIKKELANKLKSGNLTYKSTAEKKEEQAAAKSSQNQQEQQALSKKVKLSPQYGIVVSNELFHNGNVEAWKKIIASYECKYPDTKVLVFYDNEQIHDINTLFKWGKVKHGTMIFFCLLGPEFRSASKLRRYLTQGASIKFEAFLKGTPNQILNLF